MFDRTELHMREQLRAERRRLVPAIRDEASERERGPRSRRGTKRGRDLHAGDRSRTPADLGNDAEACRHDQRVACAHRDVQRAAGQARTTRILRADLSRLMEHRAERIAGALAVEKRVLAILAVRVVRTRWRSGG